MSTQEQLNKEGQKLFGNLSFGQAFSNPHGMDFPKFSSGFTPKPVEYGIEGTPNPFIITELKSGKKYLISHASISFNKFLTSNSEVILIQL